MSLPRKSRVSCAYCPRRAKEILRGKPVCHKCERIYALIKDVAASTIKEEK